MSTVTVDMTITVNVEQADGITAVLTLTLEEARALKDALISAIGAQNPVKREELFAPVIQPKGGFIKTDTDATKLTWICHCGHGSGCRPGHCLNVPA